MEFENLLKLIETVSKSDLDSVSYEADGTRIKLCKKRNNVICMDGSTINGVSAAPSYANHADGAQGNTADGSAEEEAKQGETGHIVKSPLVGIFYAAPSEDAAPFVSVGDTVAKGQTLSIIEAMKLMNEIESEYDGTVKEIYVKNGEAVEYGQPLFLIG